MKPAQGKFPRIEFNDDGEPVAPHRRRPKRRDPRYYESTGLFIESWYEGSWHLVRYYRDMDSMCRSFRSRGKEDYFPSGRESSASRMRWPGDGRDHFMPYQTWFHEYWNRPRHPEPTEAPKPVSEKFPRLVARAIERGGVLKLVYLDRYENKTVRTIRPLRWVEKNRFTAFCELRNEERDFCIDRILDCQPAALPDPEPTNSGATDRKVRDDL